MARSATDPRSDRLLNDRTLRDRVAALHAGGEAIDDRALDLALGLRPEVAEPTASLGELLLTYGNHRLDRGDLPYAVIRELFHRLPPAGGEPLVDLGCGYGRIAFYGRLLDEGFRFWGIEIVRERVAEARRVRDALGLTGLEFVQGDATLAGWPESGRYCLMNPDLPKHAPALVDRLHEQARRRSILVASVSTTNAHLAAEPWLAEVPPVPAWPLALRLFASRG